MSELIRMDTPQLERLVSYYWRYGRAGKALDTYDIARLIGQRVGFKITEARVANALARIRSRQVREKAA